MGILHRSYIISLWVKTLNSILEVNLTVIAPTPNAVISVIDVTVIAIPARFMVRAILSSTGRFFSSSLKFSRAFTITNMSSTPIPGEKNKLTNKRWHRKLKTLKLAWDQGIIQGNFNAQGADRNKTKRLLKPYAKK